MELARHEEAVEHLRRAVEAAPGHDAAWFVLGRSALSIKDFRTAFVAFSRAWSRVPDDRDVGHHKRREQPNGAFR